MTLARRLWQYQAERFPLVRHGPLIVVFAAAGVSLSAGLGGREVPGIGTYASAAALALLAFFQLRVADEVKDAEDDRRYRPERPVPRGLVSLRLLVGLGLMAAAGQALIVGFWLTGAIGPLVAVWAWMALMAVEFGCPAWLKARLVRYLISHMAIMPLIDLLITACEWGARGEMPAGLWPFLLLSFANGCVLELGRKIWSPDAERAGVETYSRLWGTRRAVSVWFGAVMFAGGLSIGTGLLAGGGGLIAVCTLAAGAGAARAGWRFIQAPTLAHQAGVETMAGVWVLVSYLALGFIPLVMRGVG